MFSHAMNNHVKRNVLLSIAASVILLVPIWLATYPPLLDWPNHLARAYILARYHEVPEFQSVYTVQFDVLPNLAVDVIGMCLLRSTSYVLTTKIILSLIIIVFVVGCVLISVGLYGSIGLSTFLALLFVYNFMFFYGFANYMLGVGLFLTAYGYWLRCIQRWTAGRAIMMSVLGLSCYFAHLSSLAFLCIALFTHTAVRLFTRRRTVFRPFSDALMPLALPMCVFLIYQQRYAPHDNSSRLYWEGLYSKLKGVAYLFASYDFTIDFIFACLLGLVILAYIKRCRPQFNDFAVAIGLALFTAFLFAPVGGFAATWAIDRRFVIPAAVFLVLSIKSVSSCRFYYLLHAITLVLLLARVSWIWGGNWASADREISDQVQLFKNTFPTGSRIYPVTLLETRDKRERTKQMPFRHTICYSVVVCHAFVPSLFAYPGQQPIMFRLPNTGYHEVHPPFPHPSTIFDTDLIKKQYDYVYGYRLDGEYEQFLSRHFRLVVRQGNVWIFRTSKQSPSSPPPQPPNPNATARGDSPTRANPPVRSH